MARVHNASAGMNLQHANINHQYMRYDHETPKIWPRYWPLNQKRLKLTKAAGCPIVDARVRDHRGYICHDISPWCIKHETVDRLAKRARCEKRDDYDTCSNERNRWAYAFCRRYGEYFSLCERHDAMNMLIKLTSIQGLSQTYARKGKKEKETRGVMKEKSWSRVH
jgi:hypothetical protein